MAAAPTMQITMTELRTQRLMLRRAHPDDLAALHVVMSDARAMHYWSHGPHQSLEQTKRWLDTMIDAPPNESDDFVMVHDDLVIGKLGAWRLPEIGFILRSDRWGQGFAAEAMAAFLKHIFERSDVNRLTADVDPRNNGARAVLERFGFFETGRVADTWQTHIGSCDSIYFALNRAN